jgi:hypothetical protein
MPSVQDLTDYVVLRSVDKLLQSQSPAERYVDTAMVV